MAKLKDEFFTEFTGPSDRGFVGYDFKGSTKWGSQKLKEDKKGRFVVIKGKKYYVDHILDEIAALEKEEAEKTPLSSNDAAGEGPRLENVLALLVAAGETAEIQRETLFTGTKFYVVENSRLEKLQVVNAKGLPVFSSADPQEIVNFLDEREGQKANV